MKLPKYLAHFVPLFCAVPAFAASQTWINGGPSTIWNTTDLDWDTGVAWTNGNIALFNSPGEAISVASVTASGLTFSGTGYSLNGGTITLTGTPTISNTDPTSISSVIAGTVGLTKAGAGTLTLTGANTYTGATTISAGTLALSGGDNLLASSATVNFSGSSTLDIGSTNETLTSLSVLTNGVTGTVNGAGGTLTLTGSSPLSLIPSANSTSRALNMSGLSNFEYNNSTGTFGVEAYAGAANSTGRSATLTLAGTSVITASKLTVAQTGTTGTANNNSATMNLGASATINADTIAISGYAINGTIGYLAGTTNAALTIRGTDGSSRVQSMTMGNYSPGATTGKVDLSTNVSGASTLDAMINNLIIGCNNRGASGTANNSTGIFTMGAGTLDATTMTIGASSSGSSNGGTTNGTFTSGANGVVKVATLKLGDDVGGGANTINATFNLNNGATLSAQSITPGVKTGTGTITRTFNWNSGTIQNYDASTDLTISSGLSTFALLGTGTHAFDLGSGRTGTVNQVMSGTGALTKLDAGTLTLTAANTYTGTTTVSAGTLLVSGSIAGSTTTVSGGLLQVASGGTVSSPTSVNGGTLSSAGTLGGLVTVNTGGTFAPGQNGSGLALLNNGLTLNSGGHLAVTLSGTDFGTGYAGIGIAGGSVTLGGDLQLSLGYTPVVGDTFYLLVNQGAGPINGVFSNAVDQGNGTGLITAGADQFLVSYTANETSSSFMAAGGQDIAVQVMAVPEPGAFASLLGGFGMLAGLQRFRRRRF